MFIFDEFATVSFEPIKINSKSKEHEKVSVQHKKKNTGSSEIIIRLSKATMDECCFKYGSLLYLSFGATFNKEQFIRISSKKEHKHKYGVKLSKQNKSRDNSAGVIRATYKGSIGLPDFLTLESIDEELNRVKYIHDDNAFSATEGLLQFKMKLSIKE